MLVRGDLGMGGQQQRVSGRLLGHVAHAAQTGQLVRGHTPAHPVTAIQNGVFTHAVKQQRGGAIHQDAAAYLVVPVIIVRKPAQRSLHPTDEHRYARICFVDAVAVHRDRAVGTQAGTSAGGVHVGIAPFAGYGIVVDHAVDDPGGNQETQLWPSKALERFRAVIFRQAEHRHAVACGLQHPANDGVTEGGMIHICLAYGVDKIGRIPSPLSNLLRRNGQKRAWHRGAPPVIEMRLL